MYPKRLFDVATAGSASCRPAIVTVNEQSLAVDAENISADLFLMCLQTIIKIRMVAATSLNIKHLQLIYQLI